jgi:hypothetical protein
MIEDALEKNSWEMFQSWFHSTLFYMMILNFVHNAKNNKHFFRDLFSTTIAVHTLTDTDIIFSVSPLQPPPPNPIYLDHFMIISGS